MKKILFVVPEDYGFISHRSTIAEKLIKSGWRVILLTRVNKHADEIKKLGVTLIELNQTSGSRHSGVFRTVLRLFKVYKKEKPDIVHHFTIRMAILGSIAARFYGRGHIVNTITGLGSVFVFNEIKYRILRALVTFILKRNLRYSITTVQNHDDYNFIKNIITADTELCLILGSGVDTNRYYPVTKDMHTPIVALPARMLWVKGVREFVEAAKILKEQSVKSRFVLIGDNDDNNPASINRKQLTEWQDSGVVEWWGHCEDMQTVLSKVDIVCLPSYREGLPKSLLEAAAAGLPIVTTDVPGCKEAVEDKMNGFLVTPRSPESLVEPLQSLLKSPEMRLRMGKYGRNMAESKFCSNIIDTKFINVYKKLIS